MAICTSLWAAGFLTFGSSAGDGVWTRKDEDSVALYYAIL